ncbi:MAG TPA: MltA domain-containing protein [Rhizomicrobium sp.]|jgi:membrane-bound lytic murein transglycosylase A
MPRTRRSLAPSLILIVAIFVLAAGYFVWRTLNPNRLGPPSAAVPATLVPVRFADLPGWQGADPRNALAAFLRSCDALTKKPADERLGSNGYAGRAGDWQAVCKQVPRQVANAEAARAFFEFRFAPVEVKRGDDMPALFTGYYEPELSASRKKQGPYTAPIYGLPDNLVSAELGAFRPEWEGERLYGCVDGHRLLPCPTRADIDAHGLSNAPVLAYADDPVAVFFLHIQGSGRVKLDDGQMLRIAYAGQNGRKYTPIGRVLLQRGLLDRASLSMQAIRAWMKAHADEAQALMETDQSYVFFREQPIGDAKLGSPGSEAVPLTPGASLAVDQHIHALGTPVYVAAMRPDANPKRPERSFAQLLVAQDAGGAIRGPARGDVFWGFGLDAESIAGRMKAEGRMFVLLPRAVAARLHGPTTLRVS